MLVLIFNYNLTIDLKYLLNYNFNVYNVNYIKDKFKTIVI